MMLSLLLPCCQPHHPTLPYLWNIPPAIGRKLPNGSLIVEDPEDPDALYKFTHWERAEFAWNEIDICARLRQLDDPRGLIQLDGIGATPEYLVRKMQRSHHGALSSFLFNACKGDAMMMPIEQVLALLAQIAHAMMQLHTHNIVHRDLKSENILVFGDQPDIANWRSIHSKISDFDRALELPPGQFLDAPVGSLLHMAPELLAWEPYCHKVDIYAFGMVMFEVAHGGRVPHYNISTGLPGALTSLEFSEQVVNESLRPDWSYPDPILKQLAAACWHQTPEERPEFSEIFARITRHPAYQTPCVFSVQSQSRDHELEKIGLACDIGRMRRTMEDALCVLQTQDTLIAGVFDGLVDARSSEYAARQFPLILAAYLDERDCGIKTAIEMNFSRINMLLQQLEPAIESGTTATLAMLGPHEMILAWLGDSPAWLFRKNADPGYQVLELVKPHHPERADEAARITACGARIGRAQRWLDNGEKMATGPARVFFPEDALTGVALSRALGLFAWHPAISAEPEIMQIAREDEDLFLLLGTDGVFDLLDHACAFDLLISSADAMQAADRLIAEVLQRGAPDNASVVVIDLRHAL